MTSSISLRGKQMKREVTVTAHDNDNLTTSGPVQRTVADLLTFLLFGGPNSEIRGKKILTVSSHHVKTITCKIRRYSMCNQCKVNTWTIHLMEIQVLNWGVREYRTSFLKRWKQSFRPVVCSVRTTREKGKKLFSLERQKNCQHWTPRWLWGQRALQLARHVKRDHRAVLTVTNRKHKTQKAKLSSFSCSFNSPVCW